jgi:small subunit ribosomal protein S17
VEIIEAPPRSKLKRWDLLRVVTRAQQVDVAATRAAAEIQEEAMAAARGEITTDHQSK